MNILQTIKKGFTYFRLDSSPSLTLNQQFYWIVKLDGMQGVAIEIANEKQVNEKFSNMAYFTKNYIIGGQDRHLLLLVSDQPKLFNEFIFICAGFIEKVLDAESYQEIKDNPISWWHAMKELVGNTNVEKAAYSVIAEMLSFSYLLKNNTNVEWAGHKGATVDLESATGGYEVKATVARYGSEISISSQYQLNANYLLYYRFEPAESGISLQQMVEKLVGQGIERAELDRTLSKLGYPVDSEIRRKSYRLLSAMKYTIDEKFPKILQESFVDGQLPLNITKLTYTIDLSGVVGEVLKIEEMGCYNGL